MYNSLQGGVYMRTLENNDFMVLNNIIYRIHTNSDFLEMRREFLEQLKMVLSFDSADFYLAEGEGVPTLTSQVTYNCRFDLSKQFEEIDYSKGLLNRGQSMVYRETDIISDEKRVESDYYKKVYRANNWHYALQVVLGYNEKFMGVITFYRINGKPDFTYSDVFLMEILQDHIAYRIHLEKQQSEGDKISLSTAVKKYSLTKREENILKFVISGFTNDEIADVAMISKNTLKKHILNIYRKMGVNSKVQLFKIIKN